MDNKQCNDEGLRQYIYGAERQCVVCNKTFKPRDKDSAQQFCSYACRGAMQTQQAKRLCATCGKEFLPTRPEYKTCCRACGTTYRIARRKVDPMVKIRNKLALFCCSVISRCLRGKTDKTAKMLGYTVKDLRAHLEEYFESGMSWENYGNKADQWSIDHTRPISRFPAAATVKEINALSNLRPMWHTQNCSKKNKWECR